tara:strand:- start:222 stop:518 length:297 start_codon:yes stop_codon:yes gene_type:complete
MIFIMGFFLEWVEISFIVLPLFAPIVAGLDFGLGMSREELLLWFAMLVAVNLQTSFLTPPFVYSLFYIKGVAPLGSRSARSIAASSLSLACNLPVWLC